ncbi:MAG: hypothetical protein ABSG76_25965 [Xanthobacteraceae bacterium]|jgi:hypothetical protein
MIADRLYVIATVLIVAGIAMLCQPFLFVIHVCALPVLLIGVVLFLVLDHLPESAGDRPGGT